MSKTKNEIANVAAGLEPAPDFLPAADKELGTKELQQHIIPPRLKIVQKQSSDQLLEKFEPGDLIVVPLMIKLASKGEQVGFTPIYFFTEYCTWNPIQTKGTLPAVRSRTRDPQSELARKARDAELRNADKCPENEGFNLAHCEHLNYLCMFDDLAETPVAVSFARTQHFVGCNFAALIRMRNAAVFAGHYLVKTVSQSNAQGNWYGFEIENDGWVQDKETYDAWHKLFDMFSEADIEIDHEAEEGATVDSSEF